MSPGGHLVDLGEDRRLGHRRLLGSLMPLSVLKFEANDADLLAGGQHSTASFAIFFLLTYCHRPIMKCAGQAPSPPLPSTCSDLISASMGIAFSTLCLQRGHLGSGGRRSPATSQPCPACGNQNFLRVLVDLIGSDVGKNDAIEIAEKHRQFIVVLVLIKDSDPVW